MFVVAIYAHRIYVDATVVAPLAPGMLPCAREGCKQGSYNNNGIVTNMYSSCN
jgi:hypothetical protein